MIPQRISLRARRIDRKQGKPKGEAALALVV
jgi:hypothetical protein